jgi:type IV pilus assembly protein PilM
MKNTKVIKKKIVSLDIGHKSIKVAEGKYFDGNLKIMNTFVFDTPENSLENGKITDRGALISAIDTELSSRGIKKSFMNVTYNANNLIERELILPWAKSEDLKEMVKYEIQQYLPIDIEKYVLQHKILEEIEEDSLKKYKIMVSVIEKEIVESYLDLIRKLGFKPYRFDVHPNSIDKVVKYLMKNKDCSFRDKTVAIIDVGYKNTTITLFQKGLFQMSQGTEYGVYNMDALIEHRTGLSREEVIKQKNKIYNFTIYGDDKKLDNIIKKAIIDSLNEGIREINSVFRYYTSRNENGGVDEVLICGGLTYLFGFGIETYLSSVLNMPVKKIGEFTSSNKSMPKVNVENCINAIGAIISGR